MATSLSQLRKSRTDILSKITKDLDSGGYTKEVDNRFWKLERDKAGSASAIIRFLPPVNGDELPWVRKYSYGFQGPSGKWYINDSPNTINLPDPVGDANRELYATKDPAKIEIAKSRKRRTEFISNVYIVKDPNHPENEGKVFLFKYGKKIHDMITTKAKPEFAEDTPVEVWDLDEGANFRLRIKTVDKYPNYDSSTFDSPAPLSTDDALLQKVIDSMHSLSSFHDPKLFKSYEELQKQFNSAMGLNSASDAALRRAIDMDSDDEIPVQKQTEVKAPVKKEAAVKEDISSSEDEDDMEYFKKLLADD
jgi:gp32 DNA binding protein like